MLNIVLISCGWFPLQKKWNQNETIIHFQIRYLRRQDLNLVIRSSVSFFMSVQDVHQTLAKRKLCQISLWLKIRAFGCRGSKAFFLGKVTSRGIPRCLWDSRLGTWYILCCGSTGLCAEISVCVCTVIDVTGETVAASTIHCYQYSGLLTAKPQLYASTQREWKKFHYL